jgi:hypothetical protein
MMDDHDLDHEAEFRAADDDCRHPQGRFGVTDDGVEVPLELALCRSVRHEAATYFASLAGQR